MAKQSSPPVSQPVRQSVNSWAMSAQRYVSITSSPTEMQRQSFMAVKFQGWNVQGRGGRGGHRRLKICTRQPWTIFFLTPSSHLPSAAAFRTSSQGKWNTNTGIWKAADYMKIHLWTFILKWGAGAACAASVRFGAKLIIPQKKAVLSVLTQRWDAG